MWDQRLIDLAAAISDTPAPSVSEGAKFVHLIATEQWEEMSRLNWKAIAPSTQLGVAFNSLKPLAVHALPVDWLSPTKEGTSPLVDLLSLKRMDAYFAQSHPLGVSRATHMLQKFWAEPRTHERFSYTTPVVHEGRPALLGDLAIAFRSPAAALLLEKQLPPCSETAWGGVFAAVLDLHAAEHHSSPHQLSALETIDAMCARLPSHVDWSASVPFGKKPVPLLEQAVLALTHVVRLKTEEQSRRGRPNSIELEEFVFTLVDSIGHHLNATPTDFSLALEEHTRQTFNSADMRVVMKLLFSTLSPPARQSVATSVVDKAVSSGLQWAKILPFGAEFPDLLSVAQAQQLAQRALELPSGSMVSSIKWLGETVAPSIPVSAQEKYIQMGQAANAFDSDKTSHPVGHRQERHAKLVLELTALVANLHSMARPTVRKM